ncbi:shikimate kinase [Methylacidimicrobium cyclopophantes]|uniref:shikimate kinase n=1 Tax=Methylacidimicrobium cyclopophantes TaxID=1041766 RepID=UPI001156D93F|nr:shikimate kinase [Methylacidimicrobium cyclopophantes]
MARILSEGIGSSQERIGTPQEESRSSAALAQRHLVLVGMMGCGKSFLGRWLARRSGLPIYDLDRIVSRREQSSISALFEKKGEAYFRQKESEALRWVLAEPPGILSTGGGTFVVSENRLLLLEHGIVFYLEAPVDLLAARLRKSRGRPLLASVVDRRQALQELLREREPFYRLAHVTVSVAERSREELGERIWRSYCERAGRTGWESR